MIDRTARQLWETTLGELQLQVSRPTYETWLKGTSGLALQGSVLTVAAPTPFAAECLEKRMYALVERTVERVAQRSLEIKFSVAQEQANRPEQAPDRPSREGQLAVHHNGETMRLGDGGLNRDFTFEHFVVGKSNELAHAAAIAIALRPGQAYNPLFLYSASGLGKTHLLQAIAHQALQHNLNYLYTSSEQFTNDFVGAIQRGRTEQFRERYRGVEMLLIDDIQFMGGKEHSQEAFFHTFNQLHDTRRQIVITSDRPPQDLRLVEDRLRSRFAGGLTADIRSPGLETRIAILRAKAEQRQTPVPQEVLELLAQRGLGNVRELEGDFHRVVASAELRGSPVTLALAELVLTNQPAGPQRPPASSEQIIASVSAFYKVDAKALAGKSRRQQLVRTRHIAMYLLREEGQCSLAEIGRVLGGRDHSTVLHGCNKVEQALGSDPKLRQDVTRLQGALSQSPTLAVS